MCLDKAKRGTEREIRVTGGVGNRNVFDGLLVVREMQRTSEAGTSAMPCSSSLRTFAATERELRSWLLRGAATVLPRERVRLARWRGRGVTRVMIGDMDQETGADQAECIDSWMNLDWERDRDSNVRWRKDDLR